MRHGMSLWLVLAVSAATACGGGGGNDDDDSGDDMPNFAGVYEGMTTGVSADCNNDAFDSTNSTLPLVVAVSQNGSTLTPSATLAAGQVIYIGTLPVAVESDTGWSGTVRANGDLDIRETLVTIADPGVRQTWEIRINGLIVGSNLTGTMTADYSDNGGLECDMEGNAGATRH